MSTVPPAPHALRRSAVGSLLSRLAAAVLLLSLGAASCGEQATAPAASDFPDERAPSPRPEIVAFVGVHVVPMDREGVLRDQTVIVRGERIEAIGPASATDVPDGAFVIEGRGRYLVPGLVDMHVHLSSDAPAYRRNDVWLWPAHGVTTVRVMWGGAGTKALRDSIRAGLVEGPDLLVASPGIDGPGGPWGPFTPPVRTPAEGRAAVREHATAGYDYIKVYNLLDRPTYDAIVEEARAQGISVIGHVPRAVGLYGALDAGQRTLEHLLGFRLLASTASRGGTLDMERVRELAERSAASGAWHTPTITVDALSRSRAEQIRSSDDIAYVSPGMRDFFASVGYNGFDEDVARRARENHEAITREILRAGGRILAGTDAGFGWILPGVSLHEELRALVDAGLSPFEALRAATSEAARAAERDDVFGRIVPGLRADLLLVAGNPLEDIGALAESSGTMIRGRWYSRGELHERLEAIRASYGG